MPQLTFLLRQANYLCRLRWYVYGTTAALAVLAWRLGASLSLFYTYIGLITLGVLLNAVSCYVYDERPKPAFAQKPGFLRGWTHFSTLSDLVLIIAAIHYTGGEHSPGVYLLLIYVAGMALTYGEALPVFTFTTISAILLTGLFLSYAVGAILPPTVITPYTTIPQNTLLRIISLDSLLFIVAALILNQAQQLRALWESAESHKRFLDQLNDLNHHALQLTDPQQTVAEISEHLKRLLKADAVFTILWEHNNHQVAPVAKYGMTFPNGDNLPSEQRQAASERCMQTIAKLQELPTYPWIAREDIQGLFPPKVQAHLNTYETLLMLPMRLPDSNAILGVMMLAYHRRPRWKAHHPLYLRKAVDLAALALARVNTHYQTAQHLTLLEDLAHRVTDLMRNLKLNTIAIHSVESAAEMLHANGSLLLSSPHNAILEQPWYASGLPHPFVQAIVQAQELTAPFFSRQETFLQVTDIAKDTTIFPPDLKALALQAGYRAAALFAVPAPSQVIGLLLLFWEQPHVLPPREIAVGKLFAAQVGVSLHNAHLYELLRSAAHTDALTRLPNRRAIDETLEREFLRARRYHHPFSVVMLDLNNFKAVNDRFGHQCGDVALQSVSQLLQQRTRKTDFVGRYGGDEFLVLLPETDRETAEIVIKSARQAIRNHHVACLPPEFHLEIAYGIATYPYDADELEALVKIADQRLYEHKAALQ